MQRRNERAIVTFTTDFGARDAYAAAMKAAVLRECPEAALVDVTHEVARHDVLAGSITLERAVAQFAGIERVIHVCVVDPGVGTERPILAALTAGPTPAWVICPDNGLVTWAHHRVGFRSVWRVRYDQRLVSETFHGRDVMAPLAGRLAREAVWGMPGPPHAPVLLDVRPVPLAAGSGQVIHVDAFGNCTTNLLADAAGPGRQTRVRVAGRDLGPLRQTYADVAPGQPLALTGSSGLLEVAVRNGSAAEALRIAVGDRVVVES